MKPGGYVHCPNVEGQGHRGQKNEKVRHFVRQSSSGARSSCGIFPHRFSGCDYAGGKISACCLVWLWIFNKVLTLFWCYEVNTRFASLRCYIYVHCHPVYTIQPVVKPVWQPVLSNRFTRYNRLSKWSLVYTIQPVVKPVVKPLVKPVIPVNLT